MTSIRVTGEFRYVEFSSGHVLINGTVLNVDTPIRIPEGDFTNGDGFYFVYIRPNRKVLEGYYIQNWEYLLKYTTTYVEPQELPDELLIGYVTQTTVSGISTISAYPLSRDRSLIEAKDLSDKAVINAKLDDSSVDNRALATSSVTLDKLDPTVIPKLFLARAATAAALPTNTLSSNTLTASSVGQLGLIDGVTMVPGDRLLVKNEAASAKNGIYVISNTGSGDISTALNAMTVSDALTLTETLGTTNGKWSLMQFTAEKGHTSASPPGFGPVSAYPTDAGAYWNPGTFADPMTGGKGVVVMATISQTQAIASRYYRLFCCGSGLATTTYSMYGVTIANVSGTSTYNILLQKWINASGYTLFWTIPITVLVGYRFALTVQNGRVSVWVDYGTGKFLELGYANDSQLTSGYSAMDAAGTAYKMSNFTTGVYDLSTAGGSKWAMTRSTDFNGTSNTVVPGAEVSVSEGTLNFDGKFKVSTNSAIIVNTTSIIFKQSEWGDTGWVALSLTSPWTNYGGPFAPPAYRRLANGLVRLRGLVVNATSAQPNITNVPVPFRPPYQLIFASHTNTAANRVDVFTDGTIGTSSSLPVAYESLEDIQYMVD